MKCVVCDKSIPRGQRFIGDRYKTIKFCCEECYNKYIEQKKTHEIKEKKEPIPGWKKMTDYINEIYPPNTINWGMFAKQIKAIMEEYNLSCEDIRLTIKYAIKYEDYFVNPMWGIGQFIPKYLEPMLEFKDKINKNRCSAREAKEPPVLSIKKKTNTNKNIKGKVEEFDEI